MRMIFVNLPVEDLPASRAFFTALGFEFNTDFSDASCACMVVDRNIFVMLLVRERFGHFVIGRIADATAGTEVITCLSAKSREEVDETVARAIAAGGRAVAAAGRGRADVRRQLPGPRRPCVGARAHGRDVRR